VAVDHEGKRNLLFTKNILTNQLRRDSAVIARSFDNLYSKDLDSLCAVFSEGIGILYAAIAIQTEKSRPVQAGTVLLTNAFNTFVGAVTLLRSGLILQGEILIPSILESISTVIHLLERPNDCDDYDNGTLKSSATLAAARKAIPTFGHMFGFYSDHFVHIGGPHKAWNPVAPFKERSVAVDITLQFLRMSVWLLYVTIELLLHNHIRGPRYWRKVQQGFEFHPSDAERDRMNDFLGIPAAA